MSLGAFSKPKRVTLSIILCSVLIMAFLPTCLSAYAASEKSWVRGYVVDEDGVILPDVTVELVSSGVVRCYTYTNSYGYFVMEAECGTYSLHLKKSGYAEVVKTNTVQTNYTSVGTTVMFRALKLSASNLRLISTLVYQVTIQFTAQNSGEEDQVVDFSVSSPD